MTLDSDADMADANQYESPNSETVIDVVARPIRPPYVWTTLLIFVGGCFLLLLNRQVFTNTLVFLGFTSASGMMWIRYTIRSRQETKGPPGIYVLLAHTVVLIGFATGLPVVSLCRACALKICASVALYNSRLGEACYSAFTTG